MAPLRIHMAAWRARQSFAPHLCPAQATGGVGDQELALVADASDAWLILAPADAWAPSDIAGRIAAHIETRPDVDIFYADTAVLDVGGEPQVWLKTDFDRTQLLAHDYLGPLLIVRGSAFHALGGRRPDAASAQLYDLALRAAFAGLSLDRLAEVLVAVPGSQAFAGLEDRRRVLQRVLAAQGEPLEVRPGRASGALSVARVFADPPPVTLVIPTLQGGSVRGRPHISNLLDSLRRTAWPMDRLTVLIGDDQASGALFRAASWPFALKRVETLRPPGQPFNFAAKMNRLWRLCETEHLVLMNDDVQVIEPGWLNALMTFAVEPDVGAVGARLLFPTGRVQHAGVVGGLLGLCAHAWFNQRADQPTYQDWALIQREWSIVTGAVLATRRSVLERVNGLDEAFALDFNDVDLCLKMRTQGLRVVYTPDAELIHHEKASRGDHRVHADQMAVFLRRWQAWLDADPAYHPDMHLQSYDLGPALPPQKRWFEKLNKLATP